MLGLTVSAVVLAFASTVAVFLLWRRLRRWEKAKEQSSKPPYSLERGAYDSMELTLGAMLEELEAKNQEIMAAIDRRFQQVAGGDFVIKQAPGPYGSPKSTVDPGQTPSISSEPTAPSNQDKVDAVYSMAKEGFDVITIAQRLGLGKGEVQLILELKRKSL